MPVNDCFFDNFLAGADVAKISTSPAATDIDQVVTVLVTELVAAICCGLYFESVFLSTVYGCLRSLRFSPPHPLLRNAPHAVTDLSGTARCLPSRPGSRAALKHLSSSETTDSRRALRYRKTNTPVATGTASSQRVQRVSATVINISTSDTLRFHSARMINR